MLPARSINGVNYGIECFLFSLAGMLVPGVWMDMFNEYSLGSEMIWGGIANMLLIGSSILIFSRRDLDELQRILISSIYFLSVIFVASYCSDFLLLGFYVWLGAHLVMVLALLSPCFDQARQERERP